ncbi:hypothetical protein I302_102408 [Kwoniella bestiolae CBS 10118]|uniref:Rubredoxin-like domain-containing protein n=1 Tax=Kwoniella bestiolae CBS 10118 TaxID=1296100 RepID=A0A1B9GF14_9TREE|nr:hypothetical protein I302_01098 [Kwoniella bestiolae CBS 10118]OCF29589.1 hypothetical protein I302_01098 [Kwoniella bestiolae CBS 10118]
MTKCRYCEDEYTSLAFDDISGNWACPSCGQVDQSATDRHQFVDVSKYIGSIVDADSQLQVREQLDKIQAKFQQEVEAIFDLYLGIRSSHTSIIAGPAADLKAGAKQWFERMRESEKQHRHRVNLLQRAQNRRTKYMVAIAIKLAIQESLVIVLQNKLRDAGISHQRRNLPGYTKGDDRISNPTLHELFCQANAFSEDSFGHMDSEQYLRLMFARYSRWVNFVMTPMEITLLHVIQLTNRLRFLVELPHEERLKHLKTKPTITKGKREWYDSDFSDLQGINWDQVLPHAFHLYQFQECVRLWQNSSSPHLGIALTQWAIQSSAEMVMSQYTALQQELAAEYGRSHFVASERFRDMRNMIIAWSTSLTDAGIPFPILPLPHKGAFGDGLTGYKGDNRRPIPEIDMAVAAAPTIVKHWRQILKARLRYRLDVMTLEDELWLCRKMFVVSGQVHHYSQDPLAQLTREQVRNQRPQLLEMKKKKTKPRASFKFRTNAEDARQAIVHFQPLRRARARPPPVSFWTPNGPSIQYDSLNMPIPMFTSNIQQSRSFVAPPEERSLQRMIEEPDLSSDEDEGYSSDEDGEPTPKAPSLAQINANARAGANGKQPFAFTIGPTGFNIDINFTPPPPVQPIGPLPLDSSSDLSHSPVPMSRQSSAQSSSEMGSASEAETVIRHPHGRLSVRSMLNTPSTSGCTNPSPSPVSNYIQPNRPSPTPLRVITSNGSTKTMSSTTPLVEYRNREDAHVGLLIREREEYIQFRLPQLERDGRLCPPLVEAYIWKWLRNQVKNGSMPRYITPEYLRGIGIIGDPRKMDLGGWVASRKYESSPLESLLRAGIKPQELPVQYIPHSVIHTKLLLEHYNGPSPLVGIGAKIDKKRCEEELDFLCCEDAGEAMQVYFHTDKEVKMKRMRYEKSGLWDDLDDTYRPEPKNRKRKRANTEEEEEEERETPLLNFDDIAFDSPIYRSQELPDVPSTPTGSSTIGGNSRQDLSRIRNSLLVNSPGRRDFEGISGLFKKRVHHVEDEEVEMEEGEIIDEEGDEEDWGGVVGLNWDEIGLTEELGGTICEEDEEMEDGMGMEGNGKGTGQGQGKRKRGKKEVRVDGNVLPRKKGKKT